MTEPRRKFLILFALANAGGVVAYAPLLTLIFPARIWDMAGASAIHWLGACTFAGAIAASVGNIAFGWASDLVGTRRKWVLTGLALTIASYGALFFAASLAAIVAAVVVYQLSLNMMLAPLTAWAADTIPDEQKGMLGGWLAAGPPIGAFAGVAATSPWLDREWMQFAIVCALVVTLVSPVLLLNRDDVPRTINPGRRDPVRLRLDFSLLWLARLIVQVAGAVLFSFLLFYFRSIPQPVSQSVVAIISATTLAIAFPTTIIVGRLSDRLGPRKPFLMGAVIAAAIGLLTMAAQETTPTAILGYAVFEWSVAIFLALHSAYAMQVLPSPSRRGLGMGILNLTNTLPSLIAPVLAVWLVPKHGFATLFALLAGLMVVATACLALIRTDKQLVRLSRPV